MSAPMTHISLSSGAYILRVFFLKVDRQSTASPCAMCVCTQQVVRCVSSSEGIWRPLLESVTALVICVDMWGWKVRACLENDIRGGRMDACGAALNRIGKQDIEFP